MTVDVTTITVAAFKAQFSRTFPYLPNYDPTAIYNTGDEVYYSTVNLFFTANCDSTQAITPGTDETKWTKTPDTLDNWVQDGDITNAFVEAQAIFNQGLYATDQTITLAYLYLTAHFLAYDLKAALAGLTAAGSFPVSNKAAGSVSEGYAVPTAYTEDPVLASYTSTAYGMKYLALTLPSLVGNITALPGSALP